MVRGIKIAAWLLGGGALLGCSNDRPMPYKPGWLGAAAEANQLVVGIVEDITLDENGSLLVFTIDADEELSRIDSKGRRVRISVQLPRAIDADQYDAAVAEFCGKEQSRTLDFWLDGNSDCLGVGRVVLPAAETGKRYLFAVPPGSSDDHWRVTLSEPGGKVDRALRSALSSEQAVVEVPLQSLRGGKTVFLSPRIGSESTAGATCFDAGRTVCWLGELDERSGPLSQIGVDMAVAESYGSARGDIYYLDPSTKELFAFRVGEHCLESVSGTPPGSVCFVDSRTEGLGE